uniref:Protein kinase domain-containing protein n=1 Tax=Vannella robusta TaxID=1487602 RepID=A0A7S4M6U6_9EUKA|mmetsp:Transcript_12934/g.16179  ORF Transcript_12934/g.16179 Transcript_12934/m.16179 type:complete len:682 (+) Transcript_12934:462-2507(+)|eukprot:CAMPEP_0206196526 /NCGR_PEP_ID=MMETSP0166-20121206/8503_1 /ASSEMBLY_ACC=CAM_ASM_000260 /TAXON_ID=95228 /ORGANISM="Vannella robusta, Strain DIVA3 518/3/11/1/6" /LENGTH=681 /DNA_ID=CAMNT_0053614023 /DNA_START=411 /DNA_END=2456 /DNA_ORIENTATION=-
MGNNNSLEKEERLPFHLEHEVEEYKKQKGLHEKDVLLLRRRLKRCKLADFSLGDIVEQNENHCTRQCSHKGRIFTMKITTCSTEPFEVSLLQNLPPHVNVNSLITSFQDTPPQDAILAKTNSNSLVSYLIYEHFGTTLEEVLTKGPEAVGIVQMENISAEIGFALLWLQQHQILHCDLAPHNILVDESGSVCVSNFEHAIKLDKRSKARCNGILAPELNTATHRDYPALASYEFGMFLQSIHLGTKYKFIQKISKSRDQFVQLNNLISSLTSDSKNARISLRNAVSKILSPSFKLEICDKGSELGDAQCQYYLAMRFKTGELVSKDTSKAFNLFCKSADQGYAPAMNEVGNCYSQGLHVELSLSMGSEYYQKAAEHNYPPAMYNLGTCYYNGDGMEKNYERAAELFQWCSDMGNINAIFKLGVCYRLGNGVPQNITTATTLYTRASNEGHLQATTSLAYLYQHGIGIAKNESKAVDLYKAAAERGDSIAMYNLGEYNANKPTSFDQGELPLRSIQWFEQSAALKNVKAMRRLGYYYAMDQGTTMHRGFALLEAAAAQGDSESMYLLGRLYHLHSNPRESFTMFERACTQGFGFAFSELGNCYAKGLGTEKDVNQAIKWFLRGVEVDDAMAYDSLGIAYYKGLGVPRNRKKAIDYFQLGAAKGHNQSRRALKEISSKIPMSQ